MVKLAIAANEKLAMDRITGQPADGDQETEIMLRYGIAIVVMGATLASCRPEPDPPVSTAGSEAPRETPAPPKLITGNGERNYIILEGASRSGATFTFPKVQIERNGFLVMHPFKDGKPVPTVYVGQTPVKAGVSGNVAISVGDVPATGEMFVVMLHYDMNDDGVFDFNDGITVPDAPVFEDKKLVALRYATPADSSSQ